MTYKPLNNGPRCILDRSWFMLTLEMLSHIKIDMSPPERPWNVETTKHETLPGGSHAE